MNDNEYEALDEDVNYPVSDWMLEVVNGYTTLGYYEWVEHLKECEEYEQDL